MNLLNGIDDDNVADFNETLNTKLCRLLLELCFLARSQELPPGKKPSLATAESGRLIGCPDTADIFNDIMTDRGVLELDQNVEEPGVCITTVGFEPQLDEGQKRSDYFNSTALHATSESSSFSIPLSLPEAVRADMVVDRPWSPHSASPFIYQEELPMNEGLKYDLLDRDVHCDIGHAESAMRVSHHGDGVLIKELEQTILSTPDPRLSTDYSFSLEDYDLSMTCPESEKGKMNDFIPAAPYFRIWTQPTRKDKRGRRPESHHCHSPPPKRGKGQERELYPVDQRCISVSWSFSTPQGLLPPEEIAQCLAAKLDKKDLSSLGLLTKLFYAIASPDAVRQLAEAVQLARKSHSPTVGTELSPLLWINVLDTLEATTYLSHILRRYYLVKLLQYRLDREECRKRKGGRRPKSRKRLKYDIANIVSVQQSDIRFETAQIDRQNGSNPTRTSRAQRADTAALTDLMTILHPDLNPPPSLSGRGNSEYFRRRQKLKSRLSCARNWHKIQQQFSVGILSLIPCGGEFDISIDQ